jgi:Mn-dependent DtxR family transcriptional regulator
MWENHVQAAREHLAKRGFIERARRGYWSLTPAGHIEAIKQQQLEKEFRKIDEKIGFPLSK